MLDSQKRPPPWTEDELIVTLCLYKEFYPGSLNKKDIQNHSDFLINLAEIKGINIKKYKSYRSLGSVSSKIENFINLNPKDGKGLQASSKKDQDIWKKFESDFNNLHFESTELKKRAEQIRVLSNEHVHYEEDEEYGEKEGKLVVIIHKRRERNRKLVDRKKTIASKKKEGMSCEVCGFNFEKIYGEIGKNFLECHHKKPLSNLKANEKTTLADLALLCANCHRMIHTMKGNQRNYYTIEELRKIIAENKIY